MGTWLMPDMKLNLNVPVRIRLLTWMFIEPGCQNFRKSRICRKTAEIKFLLIYLDTFLVLH